MRERHRARPSFNEIARRLNERPGIAVGVHLTLTSEWDGVKWRPLTGGKTIVDADGYLPATTKSFLGAKPDRAEVERNFARRSSEPVVTSSRLNGCGLTFRTAVATPELRALTQRLAAEYKLPLLGWHFGIQSLRHPQPVAGETLSKALIRRLETLEDATYLVIEHPALDTAESRALGHPGYRDVAAQRAAIVQAWTDAVKEAVRKKGIIPMSPEEARAALK